MENIQRDLEKEITKNLTPKPRKTAKKWTLMIVGDHGKIIPLDNILMLLLVFVLILAILLTSAFFVYVFYKGPIDENDALNGALVTANQKIKALQNEKDVLLAKLVIAQTKFEEKNKKIKNETGKPNDKPVKTTLTATSSQGISSKSVISPEKESGLQSSDSLTKKKQENELEKGTQTKLPEKAVVDAPYMELPPFMEKPVVGVERFNVFTSKDDNTLRVQFRVTNVSGKKEPVSGYAFVALQDNEKEKKNWLLLPQGKLVKGKPSSARNGRYFSIVRFRTVRFSAEVEDPSLYKKATVFIVSSEEELMLEKNLSVEIQEMPLDSED